MKGGGGGYAGADPELFLDRGFQYDLSVQVQGGGGGHQCRRLCLNKKEAKTLTGFQHTVETTLDPPLVRPQPPPPPPDPRLGCISPTYITHTHIYTYINIIPYPNCFALERCKNYLNILIRTMQSYAILKFTY